MVADGGVADGIVVVASGEGVAGDTPGE